MDWKETVMSRDEIRGAYLKGAIGVAQRQAQITGDIAYKAGVKAGYKQRELDPLDKESRCEKCFADGEKAGMKLVADMIDNKFLLMFTRYPDWWQDFKKKQGIE